MCKIDPELKPEFLEDIRKIYEVTPVPAEAGAEEAPKPTEMVRHPLTGALQAKPKQSKRQARLEALYGKPRTIIVPRGRTGRGLTAEEIRAGLDASAAQGEPTYLKWNLE